MADPNDWSWLYDETARQQAEAAAQRQAAYDAEIAQAAQQYSSPQYQQDFFNQTGSTTQQAARAGALSVGSGAGWGQQGDAEMGAINQQVAGQRQLQAQNARYGSDLSWLDPSFQRSAVGVGPSQAAQAYADPATIAAQQNAYGGLSSLANTPIQWQSAAQQQGMFDQWGAVAQGQGAPTFMGNGQQAGIMSNLQGLQAPNWSGSDALQQDAYGAISNSYNPQYRSEADQVNAMNQIASNNSAQQNQWLNAINSNNGAQQQAWLDNIGANNSSAQQAAVHQLGLNNSAGQYDAISRLEQNNGLAQSEWEARILQNSSYNQQSALNKLNLNNSGQQNQWLNQIAANNSGQQQGVFNNLQDLYKSGGTQGLDWDDGARQQQQYGSLQEIIGGGGATAIEMANRQTQRADQEQWLRSQREADQQDYAERGLTGSGQELLSLAADRQAAAGRNSLGDLQTASQLEQRRLQAIGLSSDLAGQMRGQTQTEQLAEAQRADSALYASADMANSIRGMDLQRATAGAATAGQIRSLDQQRDLGAIDAENAIRSMDLQRDVSGGQLASQIRGMDLQRDLGIGDMENAVRQMDIQRDLGVVDGQNAIRGMDLQRDIAGAGVASDIRGMDLQRDVAGGQLASNIRGMDLQRDTAVGDMANALRSNAYQEQSFLAQNSLNRAVAQGGLATDMRGQNFQEQSFNANYNLNNLSTQAQLAGQMRGQTFDENSYLDTRSLNALAQQTILANTLRQQQFNEQSFARDSQAGLYGQMGTLGTNMRNASFNESYSRGSAADQINQYNASAINSANSQNTAFLQNSYQQMMTNRQNWETNVLNQGLDAASLQQRNAAQQQQFGYGQAGQLGAYDATAYNNAQNARNGAISGQAIQGGQQALGYQNAETAARNNAGATAGAELAGFITMGAAGMPGTGGGAPSAPTTAGGQFTPGGSAPLSTSGQTWAGGGAPLAASYNPWDPTKNRSY